MDLADQLRSQVSEIAGVSIHDLGVTKCGIVTFSVRDVDSRRLLLELRSRSINVDISTAEDTRLDFEARGLRSMIRASVHYFNTRDEIARFRETVQSLSRALAQSGAMS